MCPSHTRSAASVTRLIMLTGKRISLPTSPPSLTLFLILSSWSIFPISLSQPSQLKHLLTFPIGTAAINDLGEFAWSHFRNGKALPTRACDVPPPPHYRYHLLAGAKQPPIKITKSGGIRAISGELLSFMDYISKINKSRPLSLSPTLSICAPPWLYIAAYISINRKHFAIDCA